MQQKIKELRIKIDGLTQLTKDLKIPKTFTIEDFGIIKSKEIDKAVDSLLLAKAWLGKILQELGEPTSYKSDGNRHSKEDIEPTADKSLPIELKVQINENKPIGASVRDMNHIEKVDWLRQEISKIINSLPSYNEWCEEFCQKEIFDKCDTMDKEEYVEFEEKMYQIIPDWSEEIVFTYKYLSEARFWLGWELQRIKETE